MLWTLCSHVRIDIGVVCVLNIEGLLQYVLLHDSRVVHVTSEQFAHNCPSGELAVCTAMYVDCLTLPICRSFMSYDACDVSLRLCAVHAEHARSHETADLARGQKALHMGGTILAA